MYSGRRLDARQDFTNPKSEGIVYYIMTIVTVTGFEKCGTLRKGEGKWGLGVSQKSHLSLRRWLVKPVFTHVALVMKVPDDKTMGHMRVLLRFFS